MDFQRDSGLAASIIKERVSSLEALRVILVRWPGSPADFASSLLTANSGDVERVEKAIARFYTRQCFKVMARAPAVPHQVPVA